MGERLPLPSLVGKACTLAPEGFTEFFLASAGTGGAFVGLLFVAISIGPQRTFGESAVAGAPRQHLAEATFLTLIDGFVLSSIALIPGIDVGWVALVMGIVAVSSPSVSPGSSPSSTGTESRATHPGGISCASSA